MKILVLVSACGPAQRAAVHALVAAAAARHEVRVLAPDAEGAALRALGVPIESWKPVLRAIGVLRRAVERDPPDAVHAIGWTAASVALGVLPSALAARTVVTLFDPLQRSELPKAFIDRRLPELMARAHRVTCGYTGLERSVVERFGVDPARVEPLPIGVAPQVTGGARRPPLRAGPVLGFAGPADGEASAWEAAIDALALLTPHYPDARLWMAAGGRAGQRVRAYVRLRRVTQHVALFDDLPASELFASIDLILVPRARDAVPAALPQALVDGVPVIAANVPGIADILMPYETGWLVPDDAEGLAAGVTDAWPQIDAAWRGAGQQRASAVEQFDPARIAARCERLYESAAGAPPPGAEASASEATY